MAPILIVGASFAGLCLARRLDQRAVPYILFEKGEPEHVQTHRFHLHDWAFSPLLGASASDKKKLRRFKLGVAVDSALERIGSSDSVTVDDAGGFKRKLGDAGFRANRALLNSRLRGHPSRTGGKLESNFRYSHQLDRVDTTDQGVLASFSNGAKVKGSLLVAADGVHSAVRTQLLPDLPFEVLDFCVYYGQMQLKPQEFKPYAEVLKLATKLSASKDGVALALSINQRSKEMVRAGWTYSRRATSTDDPLFRPGRAKNKAHDIPPELYEEMEELGEKLPDPVKLLCSSKRMDEQGDRVVHWLMRSLAVPVDQLEALAEKRVVLLGDAAHPMPLLTADGANHAILDGLELGNTLASSGEELVDSIKKFYQEAQARWQQGAKEAKERLEEMHPVQASTASRQASRGASSRRNLEERRLEAAEG